jgi:septal ring factor EnvC (AmiA/AmiB activator)
MICLGGFGGLDPRAALIAGLGFVLPISLAAVLAQERPGPPAQNEAADPLKTLKQRDEELKAARDEQRKSAETEAALRHEIEQIGADRAKLNQDLIDTAARLRGVESKVASTQERLKRRAARGDR